MAVQLDREGWLQLFTQSRRPTGFLSRLFTMKPGGVFAGKKVAIDVERRGEKVAVPVTRCTGPNHNDVTLFTTKEFEPPQYGEDFFVDKCELLSRMAGEDPYSAAYSGYAASLIKRINDGFVEVDAMIARAIEVQASQILQTATLDLIDEDSNTRYSLDFLGKATHFPTAAVAWSASTTKLADLESLADVIRQDGKVDPDMIILGKTALGLFLQDDDVQKQLDNRRMTLGEINPRMVDSGATFYGFVWVGCYEFQIWAYKEVYETIDAAGFTPYVAPDNVIMLSSRTRLDKVSATIPEPIGGVDPRLEGFMPGNLVSEADGVAVTTNVYITPNGKQIFGELEAAPLLVPVQIDGFGTLDTSGP